MPTTSTVTPESVLAGQAVYTPRMLRVYDLWVLGISNRFIWKCATPKLLAWYDRNVSGCHLDVGVGTGYFLDRCRFPAENPALALLDLNANSLAATAARVARYAPACFEQSVFEPWQLGGRTFDSIGMNYLLHCLPGDMSSKRVVFEHAHAALRPGGVVFGATLLGEGVRRSWSARKLMAFYNAKGVFSNRNDSLAALQASLRHVFGEAHVETVGCAALFAARR